MKNVLAILLFAVCIEGYAQDSFRQYQLAFSELKGMITDGIPLSFKRAVFVTENAYLNGNLNLDEFNRDIEILAKLSKKIAEQGSLIYKESDRDRVSRYAAAFRIMKDKYNVYN